MLGRRLATIPLYALAGAVALACAPLWIPAAALADLRLHSGGVALRSATLLTFYFACELVGLCTAAALWLARPLARWDDARSRLPPAATSRGRTGSQPRPRSRIRRSRSCALTDTFAGIRPFDVPGFVAAQLVGAGQAFGIARWLEAGR